MSVFGWSGFLAVLLLVVVLVLVLLTAGLMVVRARRLDRLHVRVDAARAGLLAVLDRRAAVVRTVAAAPSAVVPAARRRVLREAARAAEDAGVGPAREVAENDLLRRLAELAPAALAPDLAAELADADARVVVARRVHNDAVRDTRALRGRRMVRWLRLAGSAPYPRYFEIAEAGALGAPAGASGPPSRPGAGPGSPATDDRAPADLAEPAPEIGPPTAPTPLQVATARARDAVRVVALDPRGRVLLLHGAAATGPGSAGGSVDRGFWFLPGGGVEPGQDPRAAAARWFAAATGRTVDPGRLAGPVWVRDVVFTADGVTYGARETFLVLREERGGAPAVDTRAFPAVGVRTVDGYRWWTPAELTATVDVVHPRQLADLLADPGSVDPVDAPVTVR